MAAESTVYDHCMIEDILLNEKIASHLTKPIRCRISKIEFCNDDGTDDVVLAVLSDGKVLIHAAFSLECIKFLDRSKESLISTLEGQVIDVTDYMMQPFLECAQDNSAFIMSINSFDETAESPDGYSSENLIFASNQGEIKSRLRSLWRLNQIMKDDHVQFVGNESVICSKFIKCCDVISEEDSKRLGEVKLLQESAKPTACITSRRQLVPHISSSKPKNDSSRAKLFQSPNKQQSSEEEKESVEKKLQEGNDAPPKEQDIELPSGPSSGMTSSLDKNVTENADGNLKESKGTSYTESTHQSLECDKNDAANKQLVSDEHSTTSISFVRKKPKLVAALQPQVDIYGENFIEATQAFEVSDIDDIFVTKKTKDVNSSKAYVNENSITKGNTCTGEEYMKELEHFRDGNNANEASKDSAKSHPDTQSSMVDETPQEDTDNSAVACEILKSIYTITNEIWDQNEPQNGTVSTKGKIATDLLLGKPKGGQSYSSQKDLMSPSKVNDSKLSEATTGNPEMEETLVSNQYLSNPDGIKSDELQSKDGALLVAHESEVVESSNGSPKTGLDPMQFLPWQPAFPKEITHDLRSIHTIHNTITSGDIKAEKTTRDILDECRTVPEVAGKRKRESLEVSKEENSDSEKSTILSLNSIDADDAHELSKSSCMDISQNTRNFGISPKAILHTSASSSAEDIYGGNHQILQISNSSSQEELNQASIDNHDSPSRLLDQPHLMKSTMQQQVDRSLETSFEIIGCKEARNEDKTSHGQVSLEDEGSQETYFTAKESQECSPRKKRKEGIPPTWEEKSSPKFTITDEDSTMETESDEFFQTQSEMQEANETELVAVKSKLSNEAIILACTADNLPSDCSMNSNEKYKEHNNNWPSLEIQRSAVHFWEITIKERKYDIGEQLSLFSSRNYKLFQNHYPDK